MSSQSIPSHIDPLFGRKMPLYDGTVSSEGLSKPQPLSDLRGRHTLQYSGSCFPYDPRGKEVAGFTPPWSNPKSSLLYDGNPVSHLSGREGQNHVIYRQDSTSSEEGHPSSLHQSAVKQGFTLYTKSPRTSSPAAAAMGTSRKPKNLTENLSPPSENTVYLAIPKPVYGLNHCCTELGCVIGHRYSVERSSQRMPNQVYEHEWMQTDANYAERGKAREAMLQQRGLQCEPGAGALRRMAVGTYSPGRNRTIPAVIDPNYSSYPFTLPHTLFGSLSEQGPCIQTSPRGYPSFYPSHPTYEHMTSEVYQEHSRMSKYGHLTQQPMFYYPQANVEVENRTQCKDIGSKQREDVPVILKHSIPDHREHYIVPKSLHGEIPLPLSDETLHNHSFMRGFNHQAFAVPGLHSNTSQIRQLLHSSRRDVSPSRSYMDHPVTSVTNLRKDRPNVNLAQTTPPFLHVNPTSPSRGISQPGISLSSVEANRFFPPLGGLHIDRPILPPTALNTHQLRDYSSYEAQVKGPMQAKGLPVSSWAWLPRSPHHSSGTVHTSLPDSANVPKKVYSPSVTPGKKVHRHKSCPSTVIRQKCLKRSTSHSSSPVKIEEEDRELCQADLLKKKQKVKVENKPEQNKSDSCMPIIDNVFSLAPYQAYLQAPGLLFPGRVSQIIAHSSEHQEVKSRPDMKEKGLCQEKQQPVVCLVSKEICADTPTENRGVEMFDLKNLKVEKVDPSDTDNSVKTSLMPRDCSKEVIKKEFNGADSSDQEPMLVIQKVDPDELEDKPLQEEQKEAADESRTGEETEPMKMSGEGDASGQLDALAQQKVVTIKPAPNTSPQLLENRLKFQNIPPQCLKLSSYKIVFHSTNYSSSILPLEKPLIKPITEFLPKPEPQTPARKHFFELHHSLCKLVSKSVEVSSKHDLETWLSQLELSGPASSPTKDKKISCLFGIKSREMWLDEEMKSALHTLLERLREYTAQERCPFPHVMRTGAVFLPMLVLKELLFPTVQGSLIDQVLQEHRVELRPTTLSEEKILIQLHKRACSSRLRKLMSLKHLPDIYADVVNLMYYTCVCKHMGLKMDDSSYSEKDEDREETVSCSTTSVFSDITVSPASPAELHPQRYPNDQKKTRVKTSSRRMFLDDGLSDEEVSDDTEKSAKVGVFNAVAEQESSLILVSTTSDSSWTCPLTSDELSSSPSDMETEESSRPDTRYAPPDKSLVRSKKCSGVILKLRRMLSKDLNRKTACYQAISDSGTRVDPSQTYDGDGEVSSEMELHRRTPKINHRWQRTGNFCHALRPLGSSSKRKHRSLLKIKYCPYLSACHSAEKRRRWVLRSAVQRARMAMRFDYPDLVGKRILHLYEEDDKSEVWYRGEVLRIHEAHTNPLKTIFEVRYDSEPEWKYYLELMIDYKKGWLKIDE